MLHTLEPALWKHYVSPPTVEGGILVLRSINDAGWLGTLRHGVGLYELPQYQPGDTLQWALLARTPTPPAVLDLVVAIEGGITSLAQYGVAIGSDWGWITTTPTVIDRYAPTLLAGIPELGKTIEIKTMLLGDPDSIDAYIGAGSQPGVPSPGKKFDILPWIVGGVVTGLVIAVVSSAKKGTGIINNLPKR